LLLIFSSLSFTSSFNTYPRLDEIIICNTTLIRMRKEWFWYSSC
jgi:hypothetical protein